MNKIDKLTSILKEILSYDLTKDDECYGTVCVFCGGLLKNRNLKPYIDHDCDCPVRRATGLLAELDAL